MQTHISFKTAKLLKEFLGESAPEPMCDRKIYCGECETLIDSHGKDFEIWCHHPDNKNIPAYQLHDLLSKPFCEAMAVEVDTKLIWKHWYKPAMEAYPISILIREILSYEYYHGYIPAVEKALLEMMEEK